MLFATEVVSIAERDASSALNWAHPLVREWFVRKFDTPTEPQEQGWPHIIAGRTTLISAPTGSGKTLAAFLACIDRLVRKALDGTLEDRTEVLYVSPLKALGNDIQKNLEGPLREILELAGQRGFLMPAIRTAVRTGDTLASERRAMLKCPPHILVTTPESLYILLTAEKSRAILRDVRTLIVDEIHAVAGSKRGAHLALSLERLEQLVSTADTAGDGSAAKPLARIGLSATQKPLDEFAHFLTGTGRSDPVVVDVGHRRQMDIGIEVPRSELAAVASNEMWEEIYDRIAELVRGHRSTLVFVNTRRLAERVSMHLAERLGEDAVAAHHGSLSRKLRLAAERKLKNGEVAVLVATASLELGIDIGFVDLVLQIGSTRSIAVALQRIGRSGHWRGAIPKARLFVTTRDELMESAALVRSIHHGELDRILIPEAPLDVLAQQIVAECAAKGLTAEDAEGAEETKKIEDLENRGHGHSMQSLSPGHLGDLSPCLSSSVSIASSAVRVSGWHEDELYALVTRAYPYRDLPRSEFDQIIAMLSDGIAARRGRYGAYLHRDRVGGRVRPRRGARLAAITSGGAIPDNGLFSMVAMPEAAVVGTLDEDFAVESNAGDIILLGNTSWRIRRVEGSAGRVLVEDAHGAPPTVPFWRGEAPARTAELSAAVADLRQELSARLAEAGALAARRVEKSPEVAAALAWLKSECGLDDSGAEQAADHLLMGRAVLGTVPTQQTVVAERFFDEGGGMQLVIHAPFGARVNKAWGLALRKRFCRSFNFELQAAATDDGLNISLSEQHSFPLADVFHFLQPETVKEVLEQAVLTAQSPIFASRWRWDAQRALALLRFQHGRKVPPQIQRIRADDLLAAVFPDVAACFENIEGEIKIPDHPLVREVMKDVLHEAMDLDKLTEVLRGIESGEIRCIAVDTPVPSQFSHEILNANPFAYLDDAPLEERRARAVEMRRVLPEHLLEKDGLGRLDTEAIEQVRHEAWPDVRDADELHDVLQTMVLLPATNAFGSWLSAFGRHGAGREPYNDEVLPVAVSQEPRAHWRLATGDWRLFFEQLASAGRAGVAQIDDGHGDTRNFWVAAEHAQTFNALFPNARWLQQPAILPGETPISRSDAVLAVVNGWMQHCGPITAAQLAYFLVLPENEIDQTLLRIEAGGAILRGRFTEGAFGSRLSAPGEKQDSHATGAFAKSQEPTADSLLEWCERRLLARIHRLTLGRLRKEIEPVTPAQFMRWLLRWQHVAPGSQLTGERGAMEVLQQLQGFEIPASAWERQILARRVADYDPKILDQLCLNGAMGWGRLSPHPAIVQSQSSVVSHQSLAGQSLEQQRSRRVIPTSVAPITFFVREDAEWMALFQSPARLATDEFALSPVARRLLEFLLLRGASFFADIVRETAILKSEVETGLWELVAAGLVTADGFDNLRSLIDPKRRAGQGHGRSARPRHSAGRWSLLHQLPAATSHGWSEKPKDRTELATGPPAAGLAAVSRARAVESTCWMLLRRYGVVFRELLAREPMDVKWRELLMAFRRLEDRGEVRAGRFVFGFLGEQFALPMAVESLRAERKRPAGGETVTLSAADPLNLVGIVVPGERVAAISGNLVSFREGIAVEPVHHFTEAPVRNIVSVGPQTAAN